MAEGNLSGGGKRTGEKIAEWLRAKNWRIWGTGDSRGVGWEAGRRKKDLSFVSRDRDSMEGSKRGN